MTKTLTDIRADFVSSKRSANDIVKASLAAIEQHDDTYRAVINAGGTSVEHTVSNLDALDAAARAKQSLAGVPILIKDNIEVAGWPTTAGSLALANNDTGRDAALIDRLRDAGAIILGKTNLSEWANFRSASSSSGWSAVGGQTTNAHDPTRSPCGSSAGSAVAVALGYVPVAIGSETNGSIVCPASVNGVVGFKPTHGLISLKGIVPLAASQDTAGPIASTVIGASTVLAAMIETQAADAQRVQQELTSLPLYEDLTGIRVGVIVNTRGYDVRRDQLLDTALAVLKDQGAEIVPDISLHPYSGFNGDEYDVLLYEFKHQLDAYLAELPGAEHPLTLEKLIAFNTASDIELSLFDQSIFDQTLALSLSEEQYQDKLARIKAAAREDGLDKALAENNLDVLVGITGGPAWTIDHINGDAFHGPSLSSLPAVGGHPHITVPMGDIRGLPIGLSFIAGRFEDAKVADIARIYEAHR